ncbi:uncharacterized protein [Palaemon carinicauda]|uniref:uncharacterized protein n=1 Tax=Palaemon carinicauda TaxID=392227 RepID=UPI0035B672AE
MLELEICDSKDLEEDIEYADKFRREVRAPRIQATQRLVDMAKDESQPRLSESGSASVDSLCNVNVRLPKLELPKFSGVLTEWQSFWDRFVALVDDSDIPTISKFCYLQSLLEGEVRAVIQRLSQTSVNYPIACNMLKERFGKPERIIFAHIQALLGVALPTKIAPGSSKHIPSLWKLQDELLTHVRSLEVLGVAGKQYGVFMPPVILSRLPSDIRLEWSREGSGHESDLSWLLKFLQREIERRERSDTFKDIHAGKSDDRFVESEKRVQSQPFKRLPKECSAKCVKCKGRHNVLCCTGTKSNANESNPNGQAAGTSGSSVTNPTENVTHCGVTHCESNPNNNILSQTCNVLQTAKVKVWEESHSLLAFEIPDICAPLFRPSVPDVEIKHFYSLQLADDYMNSRHVNVDILVGLDAYWKFMLPNKYVQYENLVAQESLFGWILSGSCNESFDKGNVNSQLLCINNVSESALNNFWNLESVGICTKEAVSNDSALSNVMSTFSETVKFNDDRRIYDEVFKEYERDCIIKEVPPSEMVTSYPVYYLHHRPVVRESSNSTKVRPVFDASAVGYNGISLNDCLECGPSLNPDPVGVLIRFRRRKVALTANITKAFLQIKVRREDQDVHRFLWNCDGTVRIMRFVRVPFGNKSSPFLLNATIKTHLKNYPHSKVVNELYNNLYVDDWLSGADSDAEACVEFNEASKIMAEAGMSLSRWNSNSKALREKFHEIFELYGGDESVKILGMQWFSEEDCFTFNEFIIESQFEVISTKRNVLSVIARCFNPLGLISPFVMLAKILFQDIWRLGLNWDEEVSYYCWTDSTVALSWIKGDLSRWKTFVANRVTEILTLTSPSCWYHCPDGVNFLKPSILWLGLRFTKNCKPQSTKYFGPLTYDELTKAKTKLFHCVQRDAYPQDILALTQGKQLKRGSPLNKLDPFLDNEGLLRIKGRLEYSDLCYESKHPIILPPSHIVKALGCFQHVLLKHAGVSTLMSTLRNSYWIVRLRRLAKAVCRACVLPQA